MRKNYKKPLAFILTLLLVFGTFGFAFASDVANGVESCIKIDKSEALTVSYGGVESKAVDMTGNDFVVIKQATFAVIWTKDVLSSTEMTALIEDLKECDGSLKNAVDNFYFTTGQYAMEGGTYYFNVSSGVYDMEGTPLSGTYAIASPWDKVSHFLIGTFNDVPKYTASYTIEKEVLIIAGSPMIKDFTFNVDVSGAAIEVPDQTITIPVDTTEGSVSFNIPNLVEKDFPFELIITENDVDGDDWTYDDTEYKVMIDLNDQNKVTYDGSTSPGVVTFVNTYESTTPPTTPGSIMITKSISSNEAGPISQFDFYIYSGETTIGGIVTASALNPATVGNLTPGAYTVKEVNIPSGYNAAANPIAVQVISDQTVTAAFSNSFQSTPPTSDPGILIIKQVALSEDGPWGKGVTVTSQDADVFYRFIVTNTGDYYLDNVTVEDPHMTTITLEDLDIGETTTTNAIWFDLADISGHWVGNTFTNEAEATGWYGEELYVNDTDTAVVTYSSGTSGGGGSRTNPPAVIDEVAPPQIEAPVEIPEIVIPEAEIPATGGLGILAFLALGGTIAAAGVSLRKK